MRRYEEDFNEEYEKGFRDGRRDALRELNESSLQGLDKYKTNKVKIGWGINRYEIKVEEGYEFPAESAWLFERDFKSNHVYTDKEDGLKFKVDEIKKGQSYYFVNSENEEQYNDFVNNCIKSSIYDTGVTANYGEQLLTLSTCEYSQ